ncbi:hypothetical protein [Pedobacter sp.]|jgi:hypothetical protein|uniref:hypothetical protein n=1 Tax=Pedobacter sp. TaxID=1411316 RepID=UPI002C2D3169|nr:hypothetical protein [Pedobacter sp.]HWW39315.1 hypothetical protein [Pedobacter sp.]
MGVLQYPKPIPATNGTLPGLRFMVSTDNLSTITTAGYLNSVVAESAQPLSNGDVLLVLYGYNLPTTTGTFGIFTVSISGATGSITLAEWTGTSGVVLPTIANHIATYTNTTGTLSEDPATAISGGNIQAGLSGTAGTLASFPGTASKGSLVVAAVANTGNTLTTISNAAMGQATVVSIPDPGAATANFLLNTGANAMAAGSSITFAKVNGTEAANAVTASGVAGALTTSSLSTAGGSSYAITWTNTAITATSSVLLTLAGGTNTTENITLKVVPGSGTATLTIYNNTAATALNGTIIISYLVI